jgi:hypothetical protein
MMAYCRETQNPKSWQSQNIIEVKRQYHNKAEGYGINPPIFLKRNLKAAEKKN